MAVNLWTAPERLYLDAAGKAVKADDPTRQSLLVAAGGTLPIARARELGLIHPEVEAALAVLDNPPAVDLDAQAAERKARRGKAPQNKAKMPGENKSE